MSRSPRTVIVGASIGGLTSAEALRAEGFDGEVVLIGDEPELPYSRPPLSKQILLGDWEAHRATARTRAELDDLGIQVRTESPAQRLDIGARTLHTSSGSFPFDELIIATGTRAHKHPMLPNALSLRTVGDALVLRDRMSSARRVAVIGSGVLGSEVASAARKRGAETLLVGRSGTLGFGGVGPLLSERLARLHRANDVELALRAEVTSAASELRGSTELTLGATATRSFDLVVAVIGGSPNTEWLAGSELDISDGVVCDSAGIAAPGISAVGDVAAWLDPTNGRPARVEHQSNAIEQAIAVASRIVHGTDVHRPVPLFWSEIHGTRIKAYGWFAEGRPLVEPATGTDTDAAILFSRDFDDTVSGVVAWNATPRQFQSARAEVAAHVLNRTHHSLQEART